MVRSRIGRYHPNQAAMLTTVLLVDDSPFMRKAITKFFEGNAEIKVLAEAGSFKEAIEMARMFYPEVIVTDVYLGRGTSVTPLEIRAGFAESKILAISFSNDDETRAIAESFGAVELLDKAKLAEELIPAIKRCVNGQLGS
jgi:DNA-binding NarL/FixJ family response regulator